jgi:hypothetical protein
MSYIHPKVISATAAAAVVTAALAIVGVTWPAGVTAAVITVVVFVAGFLAPGRVVQ